VRGGAAAIDFYRQAFGAEVVHRMDGPDGLLLHAELRIGDSMLQVSEEFPSIGLCAPEGDCRANALTLYTADVDAVFARAVELGATVLSPVADEFSGDRMGRVLCPFGHRWVLATRVEDVAPEEVERRAREAMASS